MKKRRVIKLLVTAWCICASYISNASNEVATHLTLITPNSNLQALLLTAETHNKNKEYTKAIDIYTQALSIASANKRNNDISFIYLNIGRIYEKQKKYDNAKSYFLKSIYSDSTSQNAADSHLNVALIYRRKKQSDSLLFHISRTLEIYSLLEDSKKKFTTFYKAGRIFKDNGNYDTAIKCLLTAYEGLNTGKHDAYMARISSTIGITQRLIGNYDIAQKYHHEALRLRLLLKSKIPLSYEYNNLGNLFKHQKMLDSARFYFNKAIETQQSLRQTKKLGTFYYNLASIEFLKHNFKKAEINYRKSIDLKKKDHDTLFLSKPYTELAAISIQQNNSAQAKKYLDSASQSLNLYENKNTLERHYEVQSLYYEAIGDLINALEYHKRYYKISSELADDTLIQTSQELQERFESKQKLAKIDKLTEGNNKQKVIISEQQKSIDRRNILLMISGFIILLAILLYFLIRQRQKTREKGFEVQRLEDIFKEQEIVKSKISKDLHDIIITSFDSIRLKVLALSGAKDQKRISDIIISEIKETSQELRLISHRLSPLGDRIQASNLTEIIIDQLTEFQHYRKIFVHIQLPLPDEINSFNIASQTNLYGIILEALNNIEKHAQATEIHVTHSTEADSITLSIVDNGIGFKNQDKSGIGIINMEQRAQLLNGECVVSSNDTGTTVRISFPIKMNIK